MHQSKSKTAVLLLAFLIMIFPTGALAQFQAPVIMQLPTQEGSFGFGLASGDVNGDGIADVVTGAVLANAGGVADAGQAYVFLGGQSPHTSPDAILQAPVPQAGARFGWAIVIADVNGDGSNDIIVSALFANGGVSSGTGAAYVFLGGAPLDNQADITLQTPPTVGRLAHFGWSMAAGDINGDGIDDVVVGAENVQIGTSRQAGQAFVYQGSRTFIGALTMTLQSPNPQQGGAFGSAVAVGNINGDLFADVIVGAPNEDVSGVQNAGRAHVFFGGLLPDTMADATLQQPVPVQNTGFGNALAVGPVNVDPIADIIVGAPHPNLTRSILGASSNAGEVYVFFGGILFDAISDLRLQSPTAARNDSFGGSVTTAGRSIVVGSVAIVGTRVEGRAYFFQGGLGLDNQADFVFQAVPADPNAQFSVAVASGDVNSDSRVDVIVGSVKPGTLGLPGGQGKVYTFLAQ